MKKPTLLLLLIAVVALGSCRKEVTRVSEVDQAFSQMFDITPDQWSTSDNGLSYSTTFDIPALSDAIFDHGAAVVYLSFVDNVYEALPEVYEGISYGAIHSPGSLTVDIYAVDGSQISAPQGEIYAKVILIDAKALNLHPNINLRDYNLVRSTFKVH